MLKVDVDKRMSLEAVKSHLESLVGVPANCFKLYRTSDCESSRTRHVDSLKELKGEEQLTIRLARELTSDEHKLKVYQLILNAAQVRFSNLQGINATMFYQLKKSLSPVSLLAVDIGLILATLKFHYKSPRLIQLY